MKKLLLVAFIVFVIIDIGLFLILYFYKQNLTNSLISKPTPRKDNRISECEDLSFNLSNNQKCYLTFVGGETGSNLFIIAKIETIDKREGTYVITADLSTYDLHSVKFRTLRGMMLCKLHGRTLNQGSSCDQELTDSSLSDLPGQQRILRLQTENPVVKDDYLNKCQDSNKDFIASFINLDKKQLSALNTNPCLPVVSNIYY